MTHESKPLVSVVMPVYNAEGYVAEAIQSIINQSYGNFELLIVDDASSDSSYKIIQGFNDRRITTFQNDVNLGYLKSVNFLLSKTKGDFITFQDADDISSNRRLSLQVESLISDTKLMFCGTQCEHSKNGKVLHHSNYPLSHSRVVEQLERGDTVVLCGATVMLKRQLLNEYHGYRAFFNRIGAEDLDFFWRMLLSHKYKNLPESLYSYRSNSVSITRKLDLNPLKYHSTQIALLAYWQCKQKGVDALDDEFLSLKLTSKLKAEYAKDGSLIFTKAAINQFAFGNYNNYFWCLKKSVLSNGLTLSNVKLMFLWLPLFILLRISPKSLQRKIVENNNIKFLKKMGIDVQGG